MTSDGDDDSPSAPRAFGRTAHSTVSRCGSRSSQARPSPPPRISLLEGTDESMSRRILIVEDDPETLDGLNALLISAGHDVRASANVPAARWQLRTFSPEIILVDIGLPVFDGNELAAQVRGTFAPPMPLLVAVT